MFCKEKKKTCGGTQKNIIDNILDWVETSKTKIEELFHTTLTLENIIKSLIPEGISQSKLAQISTLFTFPVNLKAKIEVGVPTSNNIGFLNSNQQLVIKEDGILKSSLNFNGDSTKVLSGAGTWVKKDDNTFTGTPIEITWLNLVNLQNAKNLQAGAWYRIIDYVSYAYSPFDGIPEIFSSGYGFDILMLATSKDSLCEDVHFLPRKDDTYFKNRNLQAWTGKYCLQRDFVRFGCMNRMPKRVIKVNDGNYYIELSSSNGYTEWSPLLKENDDKIITSNYVEKYFRDNETTDTYWYEKLVDYDKRNAGLSLYTKQSDSINLETTLYDHNEDPVDKQIVGVNAASMGFIYQLRDEFGNEAGFDFNTIYYGIKSNYTKPTEIQYGYLFNINVLNNLSADKKIEIRNNFVKPLITGGLLYINGIILDASKCWDNTFLGDYCLKIYIKADTIRENLFKGEAHTNYFVVTGDFYNNIIGNDFTENCTNKNIKNIRNNVISWSFKGNEILGSTNDNSTTVFESNFIGNYVKLCSLSGSYNYIKGLNLCINMDQRNSAPGNDYTTIEPGVSYINFKIKSGDYIHIHRGVVGTPDSFINIDAGSSYTNWYKKPITDKYVE